MYPFYLDASKKEWLGPITITGKLPAREIYGLLGVLKAQGFVCNLICDPKVFEQKEKAADSK